MSRAAHEKPTRDPASIGRRPSSRSLSKVSGSPYRPSTYTIGASMSLFGVTLDDMLTVREERAGVTLGPGHNVQSLLGQKVRRGQRHDAGGR